MTMTAMPAASAAAAPSGTRIKRRRKRINVSMRRGASAQKAPHQFDAASGGPAKSFRHRHGAQRHALARGELLGRALQLTASGKNVAPAWRANRRRIAGVEHHFGKLLYRLPVR